MGFKNESLISTVELGKAIKRRREELKLSLRDVGDLTEVSAGYWTARGFDVGRIVKSLVFKGETSGKPYLLLVSGSNRVNEAGVALALLQPGRLRNAFQPWLARVFKRLPL